MAVEHSLELDNGSSSSCDDDGHPRRTGNTFPGLLICRLKISFVLLQIRYDVQFYCYMWATLSGTLWSCIAHIITAVIGSGVLSLAWSTAQLGWIAGPVSLLCFAIFTYVSAFLLADCYRSPDSITGTRNCSYIDAVRVNLG
ncbi:hypothetical protein LWI29_010011 [Acer saccharum]|uniref:Amino acid transporter transmembrane domain-containing protein n=1 Tax=Acer saccharum TaxID=4024 RepID=A0AA39W2J2_ACESA|nr:hypothetical protein LWI29_010011 [Acer saccharum]